jgi:hypothetical protein|tara:strand:- start:91 stop:348 length:258 start_codon:yes stop_codon:yes gene_type:complete
MISRLILIICFGFLLSNCTKSNYKPIINFETSDNAEINAKYWKNLQACNFISEVNTGIVPKTLGLSDRKMVVKKCMAEYGYSVLR